MKKLGNYPNIKLISSEVDGSPEEIEETLTRLPTLGFTENKQISKGKRIWLGSVMVFTKEGTLDPP